MSERKPRKRKTPRRDKPAPLFRTFILCDQLILDAFTRKLSLVGVFNSFQFPAYPAMPAGFTGYVEMTDGVGEFNITLEVHAPNGDLIFRAGVAQAKFSERRQPVTLHLKVPPFSLPMPGVYNIVLVSEGQELLRAPFEAFLRPAQQPAHEGPGGPDVH